MNLLILGATGPTGRLVVEQALECGDTVTAFARRPETLGPLADRVTVVAGDATSADDLSRALAGQEAVISALGRGQSVRAHGLFSQAATAVVAATGQTDVSRLVWMSSFGEGDTVASANLLQKIKYRTVLRDIYADKKNAEATIRAGALAWTIVYPTTLTNSPGRGEYRVGERLDMPLVSRISRADVAVFLHRCAHETEWIHRGVVISG